MSETALSVPLPVNEPVQSYAPGSPERGRIRLALDEARGRRVEIPLLVGGDEIRTGRTFAVKEPHDHARVLGTCHQAGAAEVEAALAAARAAAPAWSALPFEERAAIFLRAADLLAGAWRARANAATMLNQSKTVVQAEIDAACEMVDFLRFNVAFAWQIQAGQPLSAPGAWNRCEYRNLEGFVLAVTPFNFTSIAGNLPSAPALMGNVVLWKPASTSALSSWLLMQLFRAAGLPDGVISFLPGPGAVIGEVALAQADLAGIHFTGSTATFNGLWRSVAENLERYRSYPRLVGETGGKNFVLAHASADPAEVATALVRGAFEYQGQKCSAASRAYLPKSRWKEIEPLLVETVNGLAMGDPADLENFMGAVIDEPSWKRCQGYIEAARKNPACTILAGGECDRSRGWFVRPTVILTTDPASPSMCEEIFGPILSVYVYEDAALDATVDLVDRTSPYGLTGAIFARDRQVVARLTDRLRHAAGNFYVNDKPTGAVVGQQPFGGARMSGTNDKAGSAMNLLRWTSVRTIKETLVPATDHRYPHMRP